MEERREGFDWRESPGAVGTQTGIKSDPYHGVKEKILGKIMFEPSSESIVWTGGSQLGVGLPPGPFGKVWRHFWLSQSLGGATGTSPVEAKNAAKHPAMHRTALHTKNVPVSNVNSAEVEKPWPA